MAPDGAVARPAEEVLTGPWDANRKSVTSDTCGAPLMGLLGTGDGFTWLRDHEYTCKTTFSDERLSGMRTRVHNQDCTADGHCVYWGTEVIVGPEGMWSGWFWGTLDGDALTELRVLAGDRFGGYDFATFIWHGSGTLAEPTGFGYLYEGDPPPMPDLLEPDAGAPPATCPSPSASTGPDATPTPQATPLPSPNPSGSLIEARAYHTATLLPDGRVLVVGGANGNGEESRILASAELRDPVTGTFGPAGSLIDARIYHTATLLPDGRVLVVGGLTMPQETTGHRDPRFVPAAEIWDPASGTSIPTGSLVKLRFYHTATLLRDGRVLVLGGYGWDVAIAPAELWEPFSGSFSPTGSPAEARYGNTATLLPDGRVLVVGGAADGVLFASAEAWDPVTGSFGPAGSLADARSGHTATLLPDGRVLVIGGRGSSGEDSVALTSAELWDPVTGSFAPTGSLAEARSGHTATFLPDGRVLVAGGTGDSGDPLASAELWDPVTGTFGPTGSLTEARVAHAATLLPDGHVLVIGGQGLDHGALASVELWDPVGGEFSTSPFSSTEGGTRDQNSPTTFPSSSMSMRSPPGRESRPETAVRPAELERNTRAPRSTGTLHDRPSPRSRGRAVMDTVLGWEAEGHDRSLGLGERRGDPSVNRCRLRSGSAPWRLCVPSDRSTSRTQRLLPAPLDIRSREGPGVSTTSGPSNAGWVARSRISSRRRRTTGRSSAASTSGSV